ncbi:MAG TPA: glycoside hydrolase family 25 protein [Pyrinomonadaceae bacterium]|jgi:lysozyme
MTINVVVDLSHYNTVTSFQTVKADGILGVIHKATQGTGAVDSHYAVRRPAALAEGLMWGAYHFADGSDPVAQAQHFIQVVSPGPNDLLVLDLEEQMTLAGAEEFVKYVQSVTGRWPGLYGGSYLRELLGNNKETALAFCWFWLSEYGPTPRVPSAWQTWTMWQYTDGTVGPEPHSVAGIGNCDRDMFNGELEDLQRLWGYAVPDSQPAAAPDGQSGSQPDTAPAS